MIRVIFALLLALIPLACSYRATENNQAVLLAQIVHNITASGNNSASNNQTNAQNSTTSSNSTVSNVTNNQTQSNYVLNLTYSEQVEGPHKERPYVPKPVVIAAFNKEFKANGGFKAMQIYQETLYNRTIHLMFDYIEEGITHLNYEYPGYAAQQRAMQAFKQAGGLQAYEKAFKYAFGVTYNTTGQVIQQ